MNSFIKYSIDKGHQIKEISAPLLITFLLLTINAQLIGQTTVTYNYTGGAQSWVVPACVSSINVVVAGADGGGATGGNGAVITTTIPVTPGQTINLIVGGSGNGASGGYGGGGNGYASTNGTASYGSDGGGGATKISIGGVPYVIAAGGGGAGGGSNSVAGGPGGCASGIAGTNTYGSGGGGGTQTSGGTGGTPWAGTPPGGQAGSAGQGGNGGLWQTASGGGGGGGYYGGGGGGNDGCCTGANGGGGGGGGSSLVPAGSGCNPGSNNGAGYITITYTLGSGTATATNTGPYCAGATIQLNSSGGTIYSWTGPNGFTSALQNPTIPASTTANSGVYTVTASGAGCTTTATTTVTVNPIPLVNAGVDQTVCAGSPVTLTGIGATTYTWSGGITNNVAFTPAVGTITYTLTGTSLGCTNTDQAIVTVNAIPVVNAGADVSICLGVPTTLTASGASTYSWNPGALTTASITVSPATTTTYTVTGTTLGCSSTDDVIVTLLGNAVINAGPDVSICTGGTTTLSASGGATYSWDNGLGIGNDFIVTPTNTTTYSVNGTDAVGCTGTDTIIITVNPLPIVDAGVDQTVCNNTAVTLNGAGSSTYNWDNGVTDGVAFTPSTTITYTLTGTDVNGCINTDQTVVTVNPIPTVNAGLDQVICVGASVTLSGSGASTYTWDNGVSNGVAFSPVSTLVYTVSGTTAAGCTSTDQATVTVNPLPVVNAGVDQTVCVGTSVTLSGTGAVTYSWNNGITNGTAFTPAVGTITYTVTGTSAASCVNTDQMDVIVNPLPNVNAGADQTVCAGVAVTLTGTGASTYSWNNGITNGVSFVPVTTTTYTVTGTSAVSCVNSDQVLVTVSPIPNVFAGNDLSLCEGSTLVLTGSGANTYTWNNGVIDNIFFTQAVGTITYTVTGTTLMGCENTDQVNVTINPAPVISFTPNVTIGCSPLTVNFTSTSTNSANCVWNMGDGTVLSGCGTVTNTFEQTNCYNITLTTTSTFGCTNSFTATNLICVEENPVAAFISSTAVVSEFHPEAMFTNNTIGGSDYIWDFGDNTLISEELDPIHDYSQAEIGNYVVTLIAFTPFGCSDTTTSIIQVQEELIYYIPNTFTPDNDMLNQTFQPIFTSGFDPFDFSLWIFNRWGEIIFESHNAEIGWDGTYGGELVQDGIYSWKIEFKTTSSDERKMAVGHVNIMK